MSPPSSSMACSRGRRCIWNVRLSLIACVASTCRAISAILARITGWSISRLPNVLRLCAYRNDSSRHTRAKRSAWYTMPMRSWLKLRARRVRCVSKREERRAGSRRARAPHTLVHDVLETVALGADEVLHGHLDVLERDVRGARGPHAHAVHLLGRDARPALHQEQAEAGGALAAGAHCDGEKVGEHTVGDPLLLAIHDVKLAGGVLDGGAAQRRHVAARHRLGDAQADELLARQAAGRHLVLQRLRAKVQHGRQADAQAAHDAPHQAAARAAAQLVGHDGAVEGVVALGAGAHVLGGPLALRHALARQASGGGGASGGACT